MSFKYIESIYDKILQEGYKNLDDFNFGSEEWREKVNTDILRGLKLKDWPPQPTQATLQRKNP